MKTNAVVRIILFGIAILVLLGILLAGLALNLFLTDPDSGRSASTEEEQEIIEVPLKGAMFLAEDIHDIEINWVSGSITIQPGDTNGIVIEESPVSNKKYQMICNRSGDKLVIDYCKSNSFSFGITIKGIPSKDLVITVPKNWTCDSLEIDTASARVEVWDLSINKVDFDGASGTCIFESCQVNEIDLDTASGDVEFTGTLNKLDCDAASANCTVEVGNVPSRIDIDSASGDLDLTLPEDCGFTCDLDSLSGSFSSDFTTTVYNGAYTYGDGHCRINVSAMSGDVIIRKASSAPLSGCTEPDCTEPAHGHTGSHS